MELFKIFTIIKTYYHNAGTIGLIAASTLRQLLPEEMLFQTAIPRDEIYIRASAKGLPVGVLEDGGGAETVFDSLRAEVQAKLGKSRHQAHIQPD